MSAVSPVLATPEGEASLNGQKTLIETAGRIFPTNHPPIKNAGGSVSNVVLMSVGFGTKTFAIPTMVEGVQLTPERAIEIAKEQGLRKYPSFDTVDEAEEWIQKNHGNISADGRLIQKE